MARGTEGRKEAVSIGGHDVRLEYVPASIREIARNCGSEAVKDADTYLRAVNFRGNMYCAIVDEAGFVAGTFAKSHFRLAEIAVRKDKQKTGLGRFMIGMVKSECAKRGIRKITLRTARAEKAYEWYQKIGGRVVGINGSDYEVEIPV